MDIYAIFKFLHVLTAIAWVGGGLTLLVANLLALRADDDMAVFGAMKVMSGLGKIWFVPASLLTVVLGAIATTLGGLWDQAWVVLGLAGFASTFLTGLLFIEPRGRQIEAMLMGGDEAGALAAGRRLLGIAKFDYTVMLIIVADMVFKPGWSDLPILAGFAVIAVAGLALFLVPALRPARTLAA